MRRTIFLVALTVSWLTGPGSTACGLNGSTLDQEGPPGAFRLADVRIEMRRLGCLGNCPVYTVVLKGDGSGVYEGRKHVKTVGKRSFPVGQEALQAILQGFYDIRFFTLTDADLRSLQDVRADSSGQVTVMDVPDQIVLDVEEIWLSISIGPYHKETNALAFGLASSRVWALGRLVDRVAATKKWTGQ